MIRFKIRHFEIYSNHLEEVIMNVKFRFPKLLIWGSIALLLFGITGCSLPMDPLSDPSASKETEESSEQDSKKESKDEEQGSGEGQDASKDGDGDDEEQSGQEQGSTEGEDGDDGEQGSGQGQEAAEGGDDEDEKQSGQGQGSTEGGDGDDGERGSGQGQGTAEGGEGDDGEQGSGQGQDATEGGDDEDEERNPGEEEDESKEDENGEILALENLVIKIGKIEKAEEGVYPDLGGITRYRLDFLGENGKTAESLYLEANEELAVRLDAGEWEIRAYGLLTGGAGQPSPAAISGTVHVTVYESGTETVLIVPDGPAAGNEEQGFLSLDIDYPEKNIWEAVLTVSIRSNGNSFIPYKYFNLTAPGAKGQKIPLSPGTYKVESRFLSHNVNTGSTEIVHIYPGLETRSSRVTIAGSLFPNAGEFSSVDELKTYLDAQPENTADNPYPVKISGVDLSNKEKTGETLKTLYDALSRYVTLDLRGGAGAELITVSGSPALANRANIVSLILPDSITRIVANGFAGYTNLQSVVLPKVTAIDYAAFHDLGKLETVLAPELTDLADSSNSTSSSKGNFYRCTALKSIYFPKLETIGHHAFYGCTALTEILLPKAAGAGTSTFGECTSLKTAVLPEAGFIGNRAFYNDKSLENLVLGMVPPVTEGSSHFPAGFPQKLWVPASAIDDYRNSAFWSKMKDTIYPITG
jgi:hypothetical protein